MAFQPNMAYLADMILAITVVPELTVPGCIKQGHVVLHPLATVPYCRDARAAPDFPTLLSDTGISAILLVTSTNMSTTYTTGMSLQPSWLSSLSWRSVDGGLSIA